jgi:hypothetical protein
MHVVALGGVIHKPASYKFHPQFSNESMYDDYDISIVTVTESIVFNEITKTICLPSVNDDFTGKVVTVAGW